MSLYDGVANFAVKMMGFDGREMDGASAIQFFNTLPSSLAERTERLSLLRGIQYILWRSNHEGIQINGTVDSATDQYMSSIVGANWQALTWRQLYIALGTKFGYLIPRKQKTTLPPWCD